MKLKPIILARLLILILAISGYKLYQHGVQTKKDLAVAQQDLARITSETEASTKALNIFTAMEKRGTAAEPINEGLAKALYKLNLNALQTGVNINSFSLAGNSENTSLASLSASVPMGGGRLMETPMAIRISYSDYAGLQKFLLSLTDINFRIAKLDINGLGVVIEAKYLSSGA